jgi:hypothetical protein
VVDEFGDGDGGDHLVVDLDEERADEPDDTLASGPWTHVGRVVLLHPLRQLGSTRLNRSTFKRLSAHCMEIVRTKDTGTLQYEIYFNDDQSECIVLERYKDSEALIEHLAHLGDLTEAILATGSVSGELLGEPSAELRASLAGSPVRLFTPYQSM